MMSFAALNLNPALSKAINACGYRSPTPIQSRSIPDILKGKDLVATAQTGTGKTAAFVLPMLHRLSLLKRIAKPRILILSPTRELALQITQAINLYGQFLQFKLVSLIGGMPYRQQLNGLSKPHDIIVGTPGRLLDHQKNHRLDLSAIEIFILDEADRMLDMGFVDDIRLIAKATPETRQTLLFSATVDSGLSNVIRNLLKNPTYIDLSQKTLFAENITQNFYMVDGPQHKKGLLEHILKNNAIFKAIIFMATKVGTDNLANELRALGYETLPLHGDLKQKIRNRTVDYFRQNKIQFLVATDVAARGIDIRDITHVINYDLPKFFEDYIHRIGRTGRAGKSGIAISLIQPGDIRYLKKIERHMGKKIQLTTIQGLVKKSFQSEEKPSRPSFKKNKRNQAKRPENKTFKFSKNWKNKKRKL